jgi:tRNA G37 N-methylase Trm5
MPLPKDAGDFLDIALPALSRNGVIHFYDFAESTHESEEKVRNICKKLGYKIRILDSVLCGSYAPRVSRVCVDFKVVEK